MAFCAAPARAEELPPPPLVSAVPIPAGRVAEAVGRLDDLAADLMARTGIPGMAVAVVGGGKVLYAKGFGVRKAGAPETVDAETVFQLASVSKSISGTVVAHEVGKGTVAWDTHVQKHLPWFRLKDEWISTHVTIADMMAHRSGLPDHGGDDLEDMGYDRRQVLERLRLLPLASFRDSYAYTNFGFTAAGEAVAVAAGKAWADLADEAIFRPLGMETASYRFKDFVARPNRAFGHVRENGAFVAKFQREPDAQAPAGGASASVRDMARWLLMVLGNGTAEGREIVPEKALLPAIRAEVIAAPSATVAARPGFYGYGFDVSIGAGGRVALAHSGAFSLGAATSYRMVPSADVAIIALTNTWPEGVPEALCASFTDLVEFGKVTRDWLAAYRPFMEALNAPTGTLRDKAPPPDAAPAGPLADYAGTYGNDYYGPVVVAAEGGGLTLTLGPAQLRYRLSHYAGNVFTFAPRSENETSGSVSAATFLREGEGAARRLVIEYLDKNGLGTFTR